jgi:hypothetical protein
MGGQNHATPQADEQAKENDPVENQPEAAAAPTVQAEEAKPEEVKKPEE